MSAWDVDWVLFGTIIFMMILLTLGKVDILGAAFFVVTVYRLPHPKRAPNP
jgi:hypothetical protein